MSRKHYLFGIQKGMRPCHCITSSLLLERRRASFGEVVLSNEAFDPSGDGYDALRSGHGGDLNAQCKWKRFVELEVAMFTRPNRGGDVVNDLASVPRFRRST